MRLVKINPQVAQLALHLVVLHADLHDLGVLKAALPHTLIHLAEQQRRPAQPSILFDHTSSVDVDPFCSTQFQQTIQPAQREQASLAALQRRRDVRIGEQKADRLVALHYDFDEARIGEPQDLIGQQLDFVVGERGVARGAAEGVVVQLFQLGDERAQVAPRAVAGHMQSAPPLNQLSHLTDSVGQDRLSAEVARDQFAGVLESSRFDQRRVVGQVVRQSQSRAMLESFDQQPQPVERRESLRADDLVQPARPGPTERCLE